MVKIWDSNPDAEKRKVFVAIIGIIKMQCDKSIQKVQSLQKVTKYLSKCN